MDYIWSPWRYDYIASHGKHQGCVFCIGDDPSGDVERLVLLRATHNFIILNLFPYTSGHLMVAPYEHRDTIVDVFYRDMDIKQCIALEKSEGIDLTPIRKAFQRNQVISSLAGDFDHEVVVVDVHHSAAEHFLQQRDLGPFLGGRVFVATGDYRWAFFIGAVLAIVALGTLFLAKNPHAQGHAVAQPARA